MVFTFLAIFILLIAISMPIAFALGTATLLSFFIGDYSFQLFAQRLWTGLDRFTLIAIPLFILAGELMGASGVLSRLLDFARLIVGRIRGSLLHINIVVSMFFGGINGSAVADTSAVGSMLIKATGDEYGDTDLPSAVTAVSSVVGPIIPPSLPMLIYVFAAGNVSVAALFLAGIVPGILLGLSLIGVTAVIAKKRNYPVEKKQYTLKEVIVICRRFLIPALLPVIMVGGIVGGIVTPTEAGSLAVAYALFVGFVVTRELKFHHLYTAMSRTVIVTAIVMIMISFGNAATWWLTIEGVPRDVSSFLQGFTESPVIFIAIMLVVFLVIGLFIEQAAAMIMLVPIFAPLATLYGIDPMHFGLVTVLALALGLVTPPVGICLFVASGIGKVPVQTVFISAVPYIIAMFVVLLIVSFFPQVYLWLPRLFGF